MSGQDWPDAAAAYQGGVEAAIGRALSLIDDEPASPTRGSFDRTWWCWKFTDFSAPRFQEGAAFCAFLATSNVVQLPPAARRRSAELAERAMTFWTRLQHADGCFDEAYPFERSFAATAFTGFYVGRALERLDGALSAETDGRARRALERAAAWLHRNAEHHGVLSNHLAAGAAALQVAGDLAGSDRFCAGRDRFLGTILDRQHPTEGWMMEYGGPDPGYQSHGMYYLAEIWARTRAEDLLDALRRGGDFLAWFLHPDGSLGGEYASRGTKFLYPAAFEMLAGEIAACAGLAAASRRLLAAGRGIGPGQADAWNFFPLLNNHAAALEHAGALPEPPALPTAADGATAVFADGGVLVARRGKRLLAAGPARGGVVKLWDVSDGQLIYEDCGYLVGNATSQAPAQCWQQETEADALALSVEAAFKRVPAPRFSPYKFVLFRLFTLTVGRLPRVAPWLKRLLVLVLILRRVATDLRLHRRIVFHPDGRLEIVDRIAGAQPRAAAPVLAVARQVPYHMGSARYVDNHDWIGAEWACPPAERQGDIYVRKLEI